MTRCSAQQSNHSRYHILHLLLLTSLHKGSGFSSSLVPASDQFRSHLKRFSLPEIQAESSTDVTDVTITVPRFYPGEDQDGSYPSALHSIHVESILTPEEAAKCLKLAASYAAETGKWDQPDSGRHQTYATCDFAIEECETLGQYLEKIGFDNRIWDRMSTLFNVEHEDMTFLDFFCANYRARDQKDNTRSMDRLEAHRDGSLLSFTVLLTPPTEFEGGGTFFDALRDVEPDADQQQVLHPNGVIRPPRAGDAVLHSGKLLHGADVVTHGERTVLVGFIDVADWCLRPEVLAEACRDFGRMDVAMFRYKRQQAMTKNGAQKGWFLNNSRWLSDTNVETGQGRSHIRGFSPSFPSVAARADPEYQRQKKLKSEDLLLRTILLPEKPEVLGVFYDDSDVTIL